MKLKVNYIDPVKAGIFSGAILFCFMLLMVPLMMIPFALTSLLPEAENAPSMAFSLIFLIFPFIYAGMGFVMTAIMCIIYNQLAKKIGGIAIRVDEESVEVSA